MDQPRSDKHSGCGGGTSDESGWTMYIGSHIHGTTADIEDDHHQFCHDDLHKRYSFESDDSMASDASSGPSHQELPCHALKNHHDEQHSSSSNSKNSVKSKKLQAVKKQRDHELRKKEKQVLAKANSAASHVGAKVRKNK